MNENEKISLTREELDDLLKEAASHGIEEAEKKVGTMTASATKEEIHDDEDIDALKFIATFPPKEAQDSWHFLPRGEMRTKLFSWLPGALGNLQEKFDNYNAFEAKIEPYYEYADDPDDLESELSVAELKRYQKKHEIYLALSQEKIRRFGIFGCSRGQIKVSLK